MASSSASLPAPLARPLARLHADLRDLLGARLTALVAHGPRVRHPAADGPGLPPIASLALVERLSYKDLDACAQRTRDWRADGLAVPLLLDPGEFTRSLDAFPLEYGDILAHHVAVSGEDPFVGVTVPAEDLRRACEAWGKAHLIHLREGFLEAGGDTRQVAAVIVASAAPLTGLLLHVARLRAPGGPETVAAAIDGIPGVPASVIAQVAALETRPTLDPDTAATLFPAYLDAVDALARFLDGWARP